MKMKISTRTFSVLSLISLAILFSCGGGGGGDSSPEKSQLKKLSETWVLGTFTYEDGDSPQIDDVDFSISISGDYDSDAPEGPYEFEVTGTIDPSPLPPSGTWKFESIDGNEGLIVLNEVLPIAYKLESNGNLSLTFHCGDGCSFDGAKAFTVTGDWVFNLVPEN
jgi:hypothetical protein